MAEPKPLAQLKNFAPIEVGVDKINYDNNIEKLREMCLNEEWGGTDNYILKNYIEYTFAKLAYDREDAETE